MQTFQKLYDAIPCLLCKKVRYLGVDVGVTSDNAAVIGVAWDKTEQKIALATHRVWRPSKQNPVNLQEVEDHILELRKRHRIVRVYADSYQAMSLIQSLQKRITATVVCEYPQTVSNTTIMGETLYDLIKNRNLVAYPDAELKAHVTNATGIETARGFRIAKEKASKKIDLAVALAMACCAALQAGKPIANAHALPEGVGRISPFAGRARDLALNQPFPGHQDLPAEEERGPTDFKRGIHGGLFGVYEYNERAGPPRRRVPVPE